VLVIHSEQYFNAEQLPEGNVLVVGSGNQVPKLLKIYILQAKKFIYLQEMHHVVRVFIVVKT
jgi:putative flavoprotein involved in K+ transport